VRVRFIGQYLKIAPMMGKLTRSVNLETRNPKAQDTSTNSQGDQETRVVPRSLGDSAHVRISTFGESE